jgi:hypothetical protein
MIRVHDVKERKAKGKEKKGEVGKTGQKIKNNLNIYVSSP